MTARIEHNFSLRMSVTDKIIRNYEFKNKIIFYKTSLFTQTKYNGSEARETKMLRVRGKKLIEVVELKH